jgi:hypothetical protein
MALLQSKNYHDRDSSGHGLAILASRRPEAPTTHGSQGSIGQSGIKTSDNLDMFGGPTFRNYCF